MRIADVSERLIELPVHHNDLGISPLVLVVASGNCILPMETQEVVAIVEETARYNQEYP